MLFRGYNVNAMAHVVNRHHYNVLRLDLQRTTFQRHLIKVIEYLPVFLQSMTRRIVPHYFLPDTLILKMLKPDWDDEFSNEKEMYKRLEPLQGRIIPSFLGDATYRGRPSILVSYIEGILPYEQDINSPMTMEEFRSKVEVSLRELKFFGVSYSDMKLGNFIICGDRIVVIDMESVNEEKEDVLEFAVTTYLESLMRQYKLYLDNRFDPW